ncbi:hypothetical protein EYF80_024965 [Liparis tanakae]|uniref:Uncharacterized protein n=1 Tax=Liparis tanakae TaxID=230148 RepID=A0A4Z2HGV7_9TELE|nr:hypothetical protein EYF80_024965 [Liparis tanakae]
MLLFSVVTRLVTVAGTALGLFAHFTFRDLLLQILVDKLWRGSIRRIIRHSPETSMAKVSLLTPTRLKATHSTVILRLDGPTVRTLSTSTAPYSSLWTSTVGAWRGMANCSPVAGSKGKGDVFSELWGYKKLSSTSGVQERPNRASLSSVSSSLSSSGRVSAVSRDVASISSSRARELRTAKHNFTFNHKS